MGPDGPDDARELVGDRDGGLVVDVGAFEFVSPLAEAIRLLLPGVEQDRARAVDQERTQVTVPAFGDATEAALETIKRQLSKTGESGFYLEDLKLELSAPYFIPVGVLNDLRRRVVEQLQGARVSAYKRVEAKLKKTSHK